MPLETVETLTIKGLASGRDYQFIISDLNKKMILMDFLLEHQIPVASSCRGQGVCRKCVIEIDQDQILTCQLTVEEFLHRYPKKNIRLSYL